MSGSLVVAEQDYGATSGTFLGADVTGLAEAVKSGSWVAQDLMVAATAIDLAATVSDPFGSLIAAGFGWLEDHFDPLKRWLNELTGDPKAVEAHAGTWENIAERLGETAQDLTAKAASDLAGATGAAVDAYREHARSMSEAMTRIQEAAEATAAGLEKAATIIDLVHGIVRDVIAQIVGAIISWLAELVFSFGLATPLVIEQATTRVSDAVAKITGKVTGLVKSCHTLEELLRKLDAAVGELREGLDEIHEGAARGEHEASLSKPASSDASHGHTEGPGRHAKSESHLDLATRVAGTKVSELPTSTLEDLATETSTSASAQTEKLRAEIEAELQRRLGPAGRLVDVPI